MKKFIPVVAWDSGYGIQKIYTEVGDGLISKNIFKSVEFPAVAIEIGDSILNGSLSIFERRSGTSNIDPKKLLNELTIEYDRQKYAVGKHAIEIEPNIVEKSFEMTKFRNFKDTIQFLAGLTYLMPNIDDIEIGDLALGMSIEAFYTENSSGKLLSEEFKEMYSNKVFQFRTLDLNKQMRDVTVKINSTSCIEQGVGALGDTFFELLPDGRIVGRNEFRDYRSKRYGICDIGSKTNDAFICNGIKPIAGKEVYNNFGLSSAYTTVSKQIGFCPENLIEDFYLEQFNENIPEGLKRQYLYWNKIKYPKNQVIDICFKAFNSLGNEITNKINVKWKNDIPTLEMILLCGGGAKILEPIFEQTFDTKIMIIENPQLANVKGFYKLRKLVYDITNS